MSPKDKDALRCSFCGKPQEEVRKLISGPSVRICDECVVVCTNILADDEMAGYVLAPGQALSQYVGSFTCPRCNTAFALHSQHLEPAGRRDPTAEGDPRRSS